MDEPLLSRSDTDLEVATESKTSVVQGEGSDEGETTPVGELPRLEPDATAPFVEGDILGMETIQGPETMPGTIQPPPVVGGADGTMTGVPSPTREASLVDSLLAGRTLDPANLLDGLTGLGLDPTRAGGLSTAAGGDPQVGFQVHIGRDGRATLSLTITNTENGGTSVVDMHVDETGAPVVDNVMTYSPPPLEEAEEEDWADYPDEPSPPPLVDADTGEPIGGEEQTGNADEWAPYPAAQEEPPASKLTEEEDEESDDTDEEGYQPADGESGSWSEDPRIAAIVGTGGGGAVPIETAPIDPPDPILGEDQGGDLGPTVHGNDIDPIANWGPDGEAGSGSDTSGGRVPPEPAPIDPPDPIPGDESGGLGPIIDPAGGGDPIAADTVAFGMPDDAPADVAIGPVAEPEPPAAIDDVLADDAVAEG